jgi:2-polyprenyl-3-methyl-5-hydroxy-6-metoxy-1,4-benzoquinol methylase
MNENNLTTADSWSERWDAHKQRERHPVWLWSCLRNRRATIHANKWAKLIARTRTEPSNLLEIGCAPGMVLEQIHLALPKTKLHGIDYSPCGIESTQRRLHEIGCDATVHFGDAMNIELDARYDIVLSAGLIEHFENPSDIISRHVALCQPGGWVLITVPNYAKAPAHFVYQKCDPVNLATHNLLTMNQKALHRLLADAGLVDVSVGKVGCPTLPTGTALDTPARRMWYKIAVAWNFVADTLPLPPLWRSHLWACGQVPFCK